MQPTLFIFGFGYTAEFLAKKLNGVPTSRGLSAGSSDWPTSLDPADKPRDVGVESESTPEPLQTFPYNNFNIVGTTHTAKPDTLGKRIDFLSPEVEHYLSQATHILITIPPGKTEGDRVLSYYKEAIQRHGEHIRWIGYLSSTGVYGNHNGQWVDEKTPCVPQSPQGILRLQAEQAWMAFAKEAQLPLHIFRLAGIYGPKRNAIERILAGKKHSIYKENQFFSRIHVEDIVAVLLASMKHPNPLSIYNVADDEPAPSHIVDAYAATILNRHPLPLISFDQAPLSAMEKEFYANNRRVLNSKLKQELAILLQYPSFREGLKLGV